MQTEDELNPIFRHLVCEVIRMPWNLMQAISAFKKMNFNINFTFINEIYLNTKIASADKGPYDNTRMKILY